MVIEDITSGNSVGFIWFLFEVTDGIKHTFISDFVIKEGERRKGYATATLMEMEQDVKKCVVLKVDYMYVKIIQQE